MALLGRSLPVLFQPLLDDRQVRAGHRFISRFLPDVHPDPRIHDRLVDRLTTVMELSGDLAHGLALDEILPPRIISFWSTVIIPSAFTDQQCLPALQYQKPITVVPFYMATNTSSGPLLYCLHTFSTISDLRELATPLRFLFAALLLSAAALILSSFRLATSGSRFKLFFSH